jgi:pimeloyl-ACP methyl ester carboxylesterase
VSSVLLLLVAIVVLASVVLWGVIYQAIGSRRDARRLPPPGHLVEAAGYRLHLNVTGRGPVVVFISGIAASSLNWARVQARVSRDATAVTTDRAGLGWSDLGPGGLTALDHAGHLRLALTRAGLQPPYVLVGHSYGGYVAQLFAARYEADVAGMVLVDPVSWQEWVAPDTGQRRLLRGGRLFAWAGAALASVGVVRALVGRYRGGSESAGRAVLGAFGKEAVSAVSRLMGEIGKMPPEVWDAVQAHWTRPRSFLAMARHFATLPRSAALVRESAARAPWSFPLVVLGVADSSSGPPGAQRAIAARSTRGRFVPVPAAGHWIHLDQPDVVEQAVRTVLDEIRTARRAP